MLWLFSRSERLYGQLRRHAIESTERKLRQANVDGRQALHGILEEGLSAAQSGLRPRPTASGVRLFTPRQLKDVLRLLLNNEPELAAYLVIVVLPRVLPCRIASRDLGAMVTYPLGPEFQGDVMMAFEKIRAVLPEQAEKGAEVLARALCLMPSLSRAKATFAHLGEPYTDAALDERGLTKLQNENFIPEGTISQLGNGLSRLNRDLAIRSVVADELRRVNLDVATLILG